MFKKIREKIVNEIMTHVHIRMYKIEADLVEQQTVYAQHLQGQIKEIWIKISRIENKVNEFLSGE